MRLRRENPTFVNVMKKWILNILLLAALVMPAGVRADYWASSMTGRTGLGYTAQRWFASGPGNKLQASQIKEYWDQGYRITSAAYTSNGWTIVMSTGAQYTMQTYHYGTNWPTDWLDERLKEGYRMTDVTQGEGGEWFIVMSQSDTPLKDDWIVGDWENTLRYEVKKKWADGYSIDNVCSYTCSRGSGWIVHFVKKPEQQIVKWTDSNQPYENYIAEMYEKGYVIDIIETGSTDEIMMVFTKRADGTLYRWGTNLDSDAFRTEAQNIYDQGGHIAHVGGGLIKEYGSHPETEVNQPMTNDSTIVYYWRKHRTPPTGGRKTPTVQTDTIAKPKPTPPVKPVRQNDDPPYTFEFKQYQEWVDGAWKIRYAPAKLVIDYDTITIEYGKQTWTAQWNDISTDDELTKELFHDLRLGLGEKVSLVFKNIEFRAVDENGYVFLKMNLMSCKDEADLDPMRRLFTKVIKEY